MSDQAAAADEGAGRDKPRGQTRIVEHAPLPPIPDVGPLTPGEAMTARWTFILLWFMRTVSATWIFKGLLGWTIILGVAPTGAGMLDLPTRMVAMICFFAVADIVAAVGLWLAAPWGGVLWLLCAATEACAPLFGMRAVTGGLAIGLDLALIVVYFALNFLAARERS